ALKIDGLNLTHLLVLDDDAVVPPGALPALAEALERAHADLAYPLVVNERGRVGWLPGWLHRPLGLGDNFDESAEDFRSQFGTEPREVLWAQGICLLVKRESIERHGLHRDDFWLRGEVLEFSLRLTAHRRGIFVPPVVVQHLPPPESA